MRADFCGVLKNLVFVNKESVSALFLCLENSARRKFRKLLHEAKRLPSISSSHLVCLIVALYSFPSTIMQNDSSKKL